MPRGRFPPASSPGCSRGPATCTWAGDSLDGTLARVRNKQRPRYGFYVDHIVDCLGALFLLGVSMDSRLQLYLGFEDPLALLFSLAQMAMGLPYFAARALGFEAGKVTSVSYEYGNTFTAVAGLLNILVILDALDTARGYKG